jgi:hypothetical protein
LGNFALQKCFRTKFSVPMLSSYTGESHCHYFVSVSQTKLCVPRPFGFQHRKNSCCSSKQNSSSVRARAIRLAGHSEPIWFSIAETGSICFWPNMLQEAMLVPSGSGFIPGASRKLCWHVSAAEIFAQACLGILVQRTKTVFGSFEQPVY